MLSGDEWVGRNEKTQQLNITKEGNCFTSYTNGEELSQIEDTLKKQGQLEEVCQRWVYGVYGLQWITGSRPRCGSGTSFRFTT